MKRPDLDTLACVNPACQLFRRHGEANLTVRKVYGHDRIRLLSRRTCGEERLQSPRWPLSTTKHGGQDPQTPSSSGPEVPFHGIWSAGMADTMISANHTLIAMHVVERQRKSG